MGMTLYQGLCLVGVPSICSLLLGVVIGKMKKLSSDNRAMKLGIQALLRAQLIYDYNKYSEKGSCPIYAKENYENLWNQYHNLGANGVMDDIHERFRQIPIG